MAGLRITHIGDSDDVAKAIEPKMRNLGKAMKRRAERLVPKRTFNLHDTLTEATEREGGKVTTQLGVGGPINGKKADYWEHVERGTSRQAAQPYLRPAMLQSQPSDLENGGR
jgi:HK97 gp10 family phage protein